VAQRRADDGLDGVAPGAVGRRWGDTEYEAICIYFEYETIYIYFDNPYLTLVR
jgi:hypothetical protein